MKKIFFIIILITLFSNLSFGQQSLKLTKVRHNYWNKFLDEWSGWSCDWRYYELGNEPIIKLSKLDDIGLQFKIEMWVDDKYSSLYVKYHSYDTKNEWSKYKSEDGNEVAIKGTTLSYLSTSGWPKDTTVQIYFWMYSSDFAIVLE